MDSNKVKYVSSVSFFEVLGIVFVILKLCHVIDWPWIWVTAPFWGALAISLLTCLVLVVVLAIKSIKEHKRLKKWSRANGE